VKWFSFIFIINDLLKKKMKIKECAMKLSRKITLIEMLILCFLCVYSNPALAGVSIGRGKDFWPIYKVKTVAGDTELTVAITALQICSGTQHPNGYPLPAVINKDNRIGLEEAIYSLQTAAGITNDTLPPAIAYKTQMPLLPEGIEFDSARNSFVVSSASTGTISLVDEKGNYSVLIPGTEFGGNGTFGLAIDEQNDLLFVVSANLQNPTIGKLYAFKLSSAEKKFETDLAALSPGMSFVNDVTTDNNANVYVTNSDQGIIYRVNYEGNAEIYFKDTVYAPGDPATQSGFNGIAFHPDGYLIVAHTSTNKLYKMPIGEDPSPTEISLNDAMLNGPDGIELFGNELVVVNNAAGVTAGFVTKLKTTDDWSSAVRSGDNYSSGDIFPSTVVRVGNSYYINNAYFNYAIAYANMPVDYLISKASFDKNKRYSGAAHEIPRVNTPVNPVGYGDDYPDFFLSECTGGLDDAIVDLQGDWVETSVTINNVDYRSIESNLHMERIEQCGSRIIIISDGIIQDVFKTDGTMFNGVNDVNQQGQPVHITGVFDGNKLVLTPVLPTASGMNPPDVTRELIKDDSGEDVLKYFNFQLGRTIYLKRLPLEVPDTLPPAIAYKTQMPLLPEGIEFDSARNCFVVSSASTGTISLVDEKGSYSVLIPGTEFGGNGTFGLAIDEQNDLLFAVSANIENATIGKLYAFKLSAAEKKFETDLAALSPGMSFVNDVTTDNNANVYVTNSDQGIIYRVDYEGNATIYFKDTVYAPGDPITQSGFNGIAFHPDGYLIVAHYSTNKLYKIPIGEDPSPTEISLPDAILNGPDGIELFGNELVVVNNAAGVTAGFVTKLKTTDDWSSATQVGDLYSSGDIFPTTAVRVGKSYYINNAYFNYAIAYANMPVDYLISKAAFNENNRHTGSAHEIPRVNTPLNPVGYGDDYPFFFLSQCTGGLDEGIVDMQGNWEETSVTINNVVYPSNEPDLHRERIEQCGSRIIIISEGLIHDVFKADGTMFNGVNDVNAQGQPVHFTGIFDGNKLVLTPVLPTDLTMTAPDVTRELIKDDSGADVLKFFNAQLGRTIYLKRITVPLPGAAQNPVPVNGQPDVRYNSDGKVEIGWEYIEEEGFGVADSFRVLMGDEIDDNGDIVDPFVQRISHTPGKTNYYNIKQHGLPEGSTWYWQVVPYNQGGKAANTDVWSFTTVSVSYPGLLSALFDGNLEGADYWSEEPKILSAGVGFCDIVGVGEIGDVLTKDLVKQAGGAWLSDINCGDDENRHTSVSTIDGVATGFILQTPYGELKDGAIGLDGLPIVFSWPIITSTMDLSDFQLTLNTGEVVVPLAVSPFPNVENNERNVAVIFGEFANRKKSNELGARFPVKCEIVEDETPLMLAGPNNQEVSAVGLTWETTTNPYDDNNGPYLVGAKLNHVGEKAVGEGISSPVSDLVFPPNDEFVIYGEGDFRLRILTTGGFSPDGVRAVLPTDYEKFFRIHVKGENETTVFIEEANVDYSVLGGKLKVLGLSDLGAAEGGNIVYGDCYQEDADNYIDIILVGDEEAARNITHIEIPSLAGGYSAFYNPGGPGTTPFSDVTYTSPGPQDLEPVIIALDDPMRVTYKKDDSSCIPREEAYPISTALDPGPISSAFYNTVSPFEYSDIERTHVHPADFYGPGWENVTVSSRALDGLHKRAYNIVTRDRNEAFLYGAEPIPYVLKFDLDTGAVAWRTELPVIEDNFNWIGLVAVHGNGDLYAVHARTLVRLDPDSGIIKVRADLPPPSGSAANDTVYNGFSIAPNGLIVGKSFGRPAGCEFTGTEAILKCVTEETPQPPSLVVTLDPNTLEILGSVELPEVATGRPAITQFEGKDYIYLNGANNVYRIRLEGTELILEDDWRYSNFLKQGQTGASSVAVMGNWVAFQTNGTPSTTPMTVHVVSQEDANLSVSRDPFTPVPMGRSFVSSSLSADPDSMLVYSQDAGRGQIACLKFVEDEGGGELLERWVIDQRTLNHLALIGPPEARVLVSTDAPGAVMGLFTGNLDYDEQVVWRSADTGEALARSDVLSPMFNGGPVTPGFYGTLFYLGLDGVIHELSTVGPNPVCE
jgi:sugar lactone lactonase YvrE